MEANSAYIALENGDVYRGRMASPGAASAELVFTTTYTGYEESLTDPSYNGQGLVFCYPLIGNYGVDERRFESDEIQPRAAIAREFTDSAKEWLRSASVVGVENVDTRSIAITIRQEGSMVAGVESSQRGAERLCAEAMSSTIDMRHDCDESLPTTYNEDGDPTIALLDCGVKESMIQKFAERGATVVRLPWDASVERVSAHNPDILFVSNGPGSPEKYDAAIATIEEYHGKIPIAGICLGQQLITLALGGSTKKMKFGHRGVNQPVYDDRTERVRMTTQNHSYEVDDVPEELSLVQWNINDKSPEGLESDTVLCRQYHPEANPGPTDSFDFFDDVLSLLD
jgi:carbamoyl-phosphate synthase small subunit